MTTIIKGDFLSKHKTTVATLKSDAAGISDALQLGSSKMPLIDTLHDIDPMLCDDIEQPDDCHSFGNLRCHSGRI